MIRSVSLALCFAMGAATLDAANKEQERLENTGVVMEEILNAPDNIPLELLRKAECVIVIPSMVKVALGIGGTACRSRALRFVPTMTRANRCTDERSPRDAS